MYANVVHRRNIKLIYAFEWRSFLHGNGRMAVCSREQHIQKSFLWEFICVLVFFPLMHFHCKQNSRGLVWLFFLFAGRPQPQVRWLVNGLLVDDQYEHNSGDVIENRLLWPSVQRTDLNAVFTCQAVNTLLVEPKENSYVLDLHCK